MKTLAALAVAGVLFAHGGTPRPDSNAVSFVVALRTFETTGVSLADQAVAQSGSPAIRTAATEVAADGDRVSAMLWAMLDRWHVPGDDRLPVPPTAVQATVRLHESCTVTTVDELGRLAELSGSDFDQTFVRDWINEGEAALRALALVDEPALRGAVQTATSALRRDVGLLAGGLSYARYVN